MGELDTPASALGESFPRHLSGIAAQVLHIERQLKFFERAEAARQDALLRAQLAKLIAHAKKSSPYWHAKLGARISPKRSLEEALLSLPILSRSDLQSRFAEMLAQFPQRKKMSPKRMSTSGSTGIPVHVEQLLQIHLPLQYGSRLRECAWHKIDPRKPLGVIMSTVKDEEEVPLGLPFRWYGPVAKGFTRCVKGREYGELYDYCAQKKPSYLLSGASMFAGLAKYAIQNRRRDFRFESALSLASAVTDDTREAVREALGAKIIDRYSSEETGMIAVQCPQNNHLHVLSPLVTVEIVDGNGAPCSIGQAGRVLVTNMHSYGMPLIRYEIGDIAEWGDACDCGITLPVIRRLWGRQRHMIAHPDGRTTYAVIYARDFENLQDLQEYRFVLHQNAVIDAQLKVRKPSPELARSVTETVQRAVGYSYPVNIRFKDAIDWGTSWKKESFSVSDAPAPQQ